MIHFVCVLLGAINCGVRVFNCAIVQLCTSRGFEREEVAQSWGQPVAVGRTNPLMLSRGYPDPPLPQRYREATQPTLPQRYTQVMKHLYTNTIVKEEQGEKDCISAGRIHRGAHYRLAQMGQKLMPSTLH